MLDMQHLSQSLDETARQLQAAVVEAPVTVEVAWASGRLACRLLAVENLACSWNQLVVESYRTDPRSGEELQRSARDLADRLRYLEEPIGLLEIDPETCQALFRSQPPHRAGRLRRYYELLAGPSRLEVARMEVEGSGSRRAIAATTTRPILQRLAADLVAWFPQA